MTLKSKPGTKSAAWVATLFSAAIAFAASDAIAQPHINVTQGQPLAGCSGRIDNLKPPAMNLANQNRIDPKKAYVLKAARILEPGTGVIVRGGYLVVRGACIVGVNAPLPEPAEVLDLGDSTLLPGLVDMHTHLLLRDEDQTWPYSILWKTTSYRIIEAVDAAIKTLNIGFTTVRDLDNEGAMFGDSALRDAIARGVFAGPRMLVAGQPLTISGGDMNLPLINPVQRAHPAGGKHYAHGGGPPGRQSSQPAQSQLRGGWLRTRPRRTTGWLRSRFSWGPA